MSITWLDISILPDVGNVVAGMLDGARSTVMKDTEVEFNRNKLINRLEGWMKNFSAANDQNS